MFSMGILDIHQTTNKHTEQLRIQNRILMIISSKMSFDFNLKTIFPTKYVAKMLNYLSGGSL